MEVLQDRYKDTKIGRIPKDWDLKKLLEIASFRRGSFPQPYGLAKWYDDENGHPFIQVYDVGKQMKLKPTTKRKISDAAAEKSVFVAKGTLILTIQGSIGRVAITQYDAYIDRTLLIFQSFLLPTDKIYLSSQLEVLFNKERQKANGSTILTITKAQLSNFLIPLPPLPEQQKIADILSTVDDQISTTDKIIEKSKELKKGLMQKLFSEGIGHTEFKDTKIGRIPKDWEVDEFTNLSVITRLAGYEYSEYWKESEDGEIFALRGYNIGKNKISYEKLSKISNELSLQLNRSRLSINDVVFPCVGSIGNAVVIKEDNKFHINQNIAKITPNKRLNSDYLVQYLMSYLCKKEIFKFDASSSQPNVLVGSLRKFKLPVPSLSEQQKIATILSEADAKIEKEQTQKAKLDQLKKGLMQQLLTGKKRVKV